MAQPVYVVIPSWNGADRLPACLSALQAQTLSHRVVVVDNGSVDGSVELVKKNYPSAHIVRHDQNKGFAGGVNGGIRYALKQGAELIALLNNDAVADKHWLEQLVKFMDSHDKAGIVTSKILDASGKQFDSSGDFYTTWLLAFPRGRGEPDRGQYDKSEQVGSASGGASLYRSQLFKSIGLFDEDFFAYYEDVDISLRARLQGWEIWYEPSAVVKHQIGATSSKIKGLSTYHSLKNLCLLWVKDVPGSLAWRYWPKYALAHTMFFLNAVKKGQGLTALRACLMAAWLLPRKITERVKIQKARTISPAEFDAWLVHDLPPNQYKLRKIRSKLIFWRKYE